jgi:hypothetical protein
MKWLNHFFGFPFFIQTLWILCVLGVLLNAVLLMRDLAGNSVLWHLHGCFFLLYISQVILIWLKEPLTAVLTLVQGFIALLTTSDFIFFPVLKVIGMIWIGLCDPAVQTLKAYEYVFVSLAFTLQMAGAYYIWATFRNTEK